MTSMPTKSVAVALASGLLISMTPLATAQEAAPDNALRIATGPKTGVYTQMTRDIQKVCGRVATLVPVASKGGLDNLMLLSANEADVGFAQVDLMQQMGRNGDQNIQELQAIMSLHSNLLHVITKSEGSKVGASKYMPFSGSVKVFSKFSDLKGARVVLVGSAHLLGQTLERQLGYNMQLLETDSDEQALAMLQANQAEAIFTTGGWPYPPIAHQKSGSGVMLAEYDLTPQAPFVMTKRNYPAMGAYNMNFLSSTNLLLTRPFKPNGERGKLVAALQKCILQHMDELQEGQYHAAWREVKNPMETLGVATIGKPEAAALATKVKTPARS